MAKKKLPFIRIKDAIGGFRTELIDSKGEPLMTSKVLKSAAEVKKNLIASADAFETAYTLTWCPKVSSELLFVDTVFKDSKLRIEYTGAAHEIKKLLGVKQKTK